MIKDSGNRRQFETGAVRDIQEGKGRCDLMPLGVVGSVLNERFNDGCGNVLNDIANYQETDNLECLYLAIVHFVEQSKYAGWVEMILEVSKHFEEGAKKYGENNWQKGIPVKCYIDSACRHYLKYIRGDDDEPHDRAFVWNIMCCMWTAVCMPELNDYRKDQEND